MSRSLKQIAEEIEALQREHDTVDFKKLIDEAELQKGNRTARKAVLIKYKELREQHFGKLQKLLTEVHRLLQAFADQPLPMGTSSVSKQFLEGAPTNGAMHAGIDGVDLAALAREVLQKIERDRRREIPNDLTEKIYR